MVYLTYGQLTILLLTVGAFFLLSGFAVSARTLRRYMRLKGSEQALYLKSLDAKSKEIHHQREAIREIIWRINHKDIPQKTSSLKGVAENLVLRRMPAMMEALEKARLPDHYRWVDLAIEETEDFEKATMMILTLSTELDQRARDSYKEFEHMQG